MFKRDPKGRFVYKNKGFFRTRIEWRFASGKLSTVQPMDEAAYSRLIKSNMEIPVCVMHEDATRKRWWIYRNEVYLEDEGLSVDDVKILILDRAEQDRKKLRRAAARLTTTERGDERVREHISDDIKEFVWRRDGGRCVQCGSQEKLEYDHIIPISKGGSNTARNIQLLCESCNREKAANIT